MTRLQPFFSTIELSTGYLHLAEIQEIVKKELKGKSGIYGFLCKTNNRLYIGSSIQLSFRFSRHIIGSKSNIKLQNAMNKYNLHDFIFIIFEYCKPEELISLEQSYFNELKPEFNILKEAGSLLGFKHSPKTKVLISESMKGEKNPSFGKTPSAETKALLRAAKIGKTRSEKTKVLIGIAKGTAIYVYDSQGLLVNTFTSARKAAIYFDVSKDTIIKYAKKSIVFKEQWFLTTRLISS